MRLFSFVRLPNHRKFNYTPRYYDPIKEEIEQRTKLIKSEINSGEKEGRQLRISTAFGNRQREHRQTGYTQIVLMVFFAALAVVYLYFGPQGVYYFCGGAAFILLVRRAYLRRKGNGG